MATKFGRSNYPVLAALARSSDRDRNMFIAFAGLAFFLLIFLVVAINYKNATAKEVVSENQFSAPPPAALGTITLITPDKMVRAGTRLSEVSFVEVHWPRNQVPAEAVQDLAEVSSMYAKADLQPNMPLIRSQLSSEPINVSLPLTPGNRAISIEVDATSSLEGHALPGTRVDVVLTYLEEGNLTSKIVVQNARVLSFGGDTSANAGTRTRGERIASKTLTVDVSPQDALKIATARDMGKLTLLMRSPDDNKASADPDVNAKDIEGNLSNRRAAKEATCVRGKAKMGGKDYIMDCDGSLHLVDSNEP